MTEATRFTHQVNGHSVKISIRRKSKRDPVFIMDYHTPDGTRHRPPLDTFDIKQAKNAAMSFTKMDSFAIGFPIKTNERTSSSARLQDVVDYYVDTYLVISGKTEKTRKQFRSRLEHFVTFCAERNIRLVSKITREGVDEFAVKLVANGDSPKTVQIKIGIIRACMNSAVDAEIIERSPVVKWVRTKVPEPEIESLEPEELSAVINILHEYAPDDFGILSWMAGSGNRPSDARSLRIRQIDLKNRTVARTQVKSKRLAKYEIGSLCISAVESEVQKRHPGPDDLVFVNRLGLQYAENSLGRIMLRAFVRAGYKRHVTPKTFRHTYGYIMANHIKPAMPIPVLQVQMGHADIKTTMRYVRATNATAHIEAMDELLKM